MKSETEEHITILTELLTDILDFGLETTNDIVSAAITGESLRRALTLSGDFDPEDREWMDKDLIPEEFKPLLDRYEEALACPSPDPSRLVGNYGSELISRMDSALGDLEEYSRENILTRNASRGEDLLISVDEVLSVAVAAARAGWIVESSLSEISDMAKARVGEAAPRLNDLFGYSEGRELTFGPDADYAYAYGFWEELACLAPSRIMLAQTLSLRTASERGVIVNQVMDRITAKGN